MIFKIYLLSIRYNLNPNVQKPVKEILGDSSRILLTEPVDYYSFIYLMEKCHLIITDSGGIQEEAPSLNKPVFVTRDTTERPEAVQSGCAKLLGHNPDIIYNAVSNVLLDSKAYDQMASQTNPYGDGNACSRIHDILRNSL